MSPGSSRETFVPETPRAAPRRPPLPRDGARYRRVSSQALSELAQQRQGEVVELRFRAGLTVEEPAQALGVSERTVHLDWRMARSWLEERLGRD